MTQNIIDNIKIISNNPERIKYKQDRIEVHLLMNSGVAELYIRKPIVEGEPDKSIYFNEDHIKIINKVISGNIVLNNTTATNKEPEKKLDIKSENDEKNVYKYYSFCTSGNPRKYFKLNTISGQGIHISLSSIAAYSYIQKMNITDVRQDFVSSDKKTFDIALVEIIKIFQI